MYVEQIKSLFIVLNHLIQERELILYVLPQKRRIVNFFEALIFILTWKGKKKSDLLTRMLLAITTKRQIDASQSSLLGAAIGRAFIYQEHSSVLFTMILSTIWSLMVMKNIFIFTCDAWILQ